MPPLDGPTASTPVPTPEVSFRERIIRAEQDKRSSIESLLNVSGMPALLAALEEKGEGPWDQHRPLPVPPEHARAIAEQLFESSRATPGDLMVVEGTRETLGVLEEVLRICDRESVRVRFDFRNFAREAIFAKYLSDQAQGDGLSPLATLAHARLELYDGVNRTLRVITNPDSGIKEFADSAKSSQLATLMAPMVQRLRSGDLHYIVTILPTASDAALDGMDHQGYMTLFLEACNQPWAEIKAAQGLLKEKFDRARAIRITNNDGTDVTLDITGQTFANSVVLKNLPGSEIFSSPLREGVNGTIVAKGRFQFRASGIMEDLTLVFEQGRIASFDARVGREDLADIIFSDNGNGEGSRYLGEIGIGTNPHLRRHMINPLLVEKFGGSFHVALGSCYSYTTYDGEPVALQNGNNSKSGVHWDVTTLLRGKGGNMELIYDTEGDERETVQLDGNWLVPGCEVLNEGWGALALESRPEWWNERYPKGYV